MSVFAPVEGQADDVKVYHLHTPFNPLESIDEQQGKPTPKNAKYTFFWLHPCSIPLKLSPTFDLCRTKRRERQSRP